MSTDENRIRLLLVDDELEFLEVTSKALARRGFEVGVAHDGEIALRILSRQRYDVVVLDVKMPGIDGVDAFRQIHQIYPGLPVILLTGHGTIQQAFETSRDGVFDYLTKPCDIELIAETARRAYDQRPAERARPLEDDDGCPIQLLLVDDEPELLESLASALGRRRMEVTTAESGEAALAHIGARSFDVAMLDAKLPGLDGIALLRLIKKAQPLIEVLVLTGHPSMGMAVEGLREGAVDFLMKPQSPDVLAAKIRDAFRLRQIRLRLRQEQAARRAVEGKSD